MVICLHSVHCADGFAGFLVLLVIVNVLVVTRGWLNLPFCHSSAIGQGSLIIGHVCFGRDWKECCFIW